MSCALPSPSCPWITLTASGHTVSRDLLFRNSGNWCLVCIFSVTECVLTRSSLMLDRLAKECLWGFERLVFYSLQGSQEVGRKVILLQTSTIKKMSPARRTLRIWMDLCREWNLRRLLLPLPQGVIIAAIKSERIKTGTGQWQGPHPHSSDDCWCEGTFLESKCSRMDRNSLAPNETS